MDQQTPHVIAANARPQRTKLVKALDLLWIVAGLALLLIFTTIYQMPFRMDDVLHIEWAQKHSFWDAWHPVDGEIVRSVRPIFAGTIWLLTHYGGLQNYFPWHITLVGSFLIALAFAGMTARYISGREAALYFTTAIYWIAFMPILNVLFWYGDLTFTIELMFVCAAWYAGLRGLLEGKMLAWMIGCLAASLGIMSKEPAIPLIFGVWIGAIVFRWSEFRAIWQRHSTWKRVAFVAAFLLPVASAVYIMIVSPTKSNRFIDLGMPADQLELAITERIEYYSAILLSPTARILLLAPIVFLILDLVTKRFGDGVGQFVTRLVLSCIFAFLFFYPLWLALLLLIGCLLIIGIKHPSESRAAWLSLPFALCVVVVVCAVLITSMVAKAQLTELAVTIIVISGWAWAKVWEDGVRVVSPLLQTLQAKVVAGVSCFIVLYAGIMLASPKIAAQEQLLRDVKAVRENANDAITWSAKNIARNATLAGTAYTIHGIASNEELTVQSDRAKLTQQATFAGGFVEVYLGVLGRKDIRLALLSDSLTAMRALDSMRTAGNGYLFLQTALDSALFHGLEFPNDFLKKNDTMLAKFDKGPHRSEIWYLRP
jgi:hypothetical protein